MKKMNKKGFTLIELLAVIIILGVLLLIAVPSVSRYIQNSRMNTYETNLSRLVDAVRTEVNSYSNDDYSFMANEYLVVPLTCIELEGGSSTKSPFGAYMPEKSFIIVDRKMDNGVPVGFEYYVTAYDVNGFGTEFALEEEIDVVPTPKTVTISKSTVNNVTTYTLTADSGVNLPTFNGATGKLLDNTCAANIFNAANN